MTNDGRMVLHMADTNGKTSSDTNLGTKSSKRGWSECDTDFNLSRHLIDLMQNCPFYAEVSRHIKKKFSNDLPTAAVSYDPRDDEIVLWVNPTFMKGGTWKDGKGEEITWEPLTDLQIRGTLEHEFSHIIFGHLGARRKSPQGDHNIAGDLAIDSIIVSKTSSGGGGRDKLPKICLVPGERPFIEPERLAKLDERSRAATLRRMDLIEKFPAMKATEWYFNELLEDSKKNGDGEGDCILVSMDDHDGWDDVPEDMREYVEGRVKAIVEKAVKHADSHGNGWGDIPSEIREEIRRSISSVVDWKAVLRQFVGSISQGHRTTSIKSINRRYPYIHPGVKRGHVAKLLVARDESGSVYDEMLEDFSAELFGLNKKAEIDFLPFDCTADENDIVRCTKGRLPDKVMTRTRSGGTNFDAVTRIVNDPKNRGRWDGYVILTDGCAPKPEASRIKRAWVLGKGCKLEFATDELQIFLSKDPPAGKGAWR